MSGRRAGSGGRRRAGRLRATTWLALVAVPLLHVAGAPPAAAHSSDPRIRTTLEDVEPALPEGVVVQVQASLAAQLVAENGTSTPLEVLGQDGRPFLRLSASGVEADVGHPDFHSTSTPTGAVPRSAESGGAARWVTLSTGTSWGWFDHRLHPSDLPAPQDTGRPARLGEWSVPLRYGDQDVTATGAIEFAPLLGAFVVTADPAPSPFVVQALPGRLPGVFLSNPQRTPMTVLGRDGEPFLRFGDDGVEVNVVSRTHVEDRLARGEPAGPPATEPRFELVAPAGTSYTWLDDRLRYPDDLPPQGALAADGPVVVADWEVPVEGVPGLPALTGSVRWEPEAGAVARRSSSGDASRSALPAVLGAFAVLVLGAAALAVRRRRSG